MSGQCHGESLFALTEVSCRCELLIFSISGNLNSVAFGSHWEAQNIRSHIYAQVSFFCESSLIAFFLLFQLFFALDTGNISDFYVAAFRR